MVKKKRTRTSATSILSGELQSIASELRNITALLKILAAQASVETQEEDDNGSDTVVPIIQPVQDLLHFHPPEYVG